MTDAKTKTCTKCGETKILSEFHKQTRGKDGLQPVCKACRREYREANREAYLGYDRGYYKANREAKREYQRGYYKANREARREYQRGYRETNREALREYKREYYEANLGQYRARTAKRRARKRNAHTTWDAPGSIRALYEYAEELKQQGLEVHVDHIHPLGTQDRRAKVCGLHCLANLQVVSAHTNLKKSDKFKAGRYGWPACNIYLSPLSGVKPNVS